MHSKSLSLLLLALTTGITSLGNESTPSLVARRNYIIPEERTVTYFNSNHEFNKNSLKARSNDDALTTAANHLQKIAPGTTYRLIPDYYTDDDTGVTHAYFIQTFNGIDIDNTQININVKRDGSILCAGSSFVTSELNAPKPIKRQQLDPAEALKAVFEKLGFPGSADNAQTNTFESFVGDAQGSYIITGVEGLLQEPTAKLRYYHTKYGELKLVWRLETDFGESWLTTYADAQEKGVVYSVADYAADAQYLVYPFGIMNPLEGKRVLIEDPAKLKFSPNGWHEVRSTSYTTVRGNNGIAQENWDAGSDFLNNKRADGGESLDFSFRYSPSITDATRYIDAATTQVFYTCNVYHDLLDSLGFTERAGNFEEVNTGKGGKGGDAVQLNAQDGSGINNANFITPPDGVRPRMRMYLWSGRPQRDGDFDQSIIVHEYTHGLSNRLTGGPANSNCLNPLESGGMGEGWSDAFATAIRIKNGDTRRKAYRIGEWANGGKGIRRYPYSTNLRTNPTKYTTLNRADFQDVHAIGTVWATMLYEVMWNLIDKHGYSAEVFPVFRQGTNIPNSGRTLFMKLLLEAMKLQPCAPTFLTARDAIIDADILITDGENLCEIWKGFAKRGLGMSAFQRTRRKNRVAAYDVPGECEL